jgi:hypothetical protein
MKPGCGLIELFNQNAKHAKVGMGIKGIPIANCHSSSLRRDDPSRGYPPYLSIPRTTGMTSNHHPQVNNANHSVPLSQLRRCQVRNKHHGRGCGRISSRRQTA